MANFALRPVVTTLSGEGAQDIGYTTVDTLDLAGGVVVVRRAKDQRGAQRGMQSRPADTGVTRVTVGDEDVGQTHVTEHGPDGVAGCRLGSGSLEGQDQPDAAGQKVNVHLQEVVPGTGHGQVEKVQANAAPPTRCDREGVEQTCRG